MAHLEDPDFYWEATPERKERDNQNYTRKPSGLETGLLYKRKGGRKK